MRRPPTWLFLLAATWALLATAGCQPLPPPEQGPLRRSETVLELTFEAADSGWTLGRRSLLQGVPTEAIVQTRPVLVTGLGEGNRVIRSISVAHPRIVHTAGTDKSDSAVLRSGTVTVRLADPGREIRAVAVEVRDGPDPGYRKVFPVSTDVMVIVR